LRAVITSETVWLFAALQSWAGLVEWDWSGGPKLATALDLVHTLHLTSVPSDHHRPWPVGWSLGGAGTFGGVVRTSPDNEGKK